MKSRHVIGRIQMPENTPPAIPDEGITRRDLLRKGAVLGGAVVWVTPVVQTVGMGRAFAANPSPTPCSPAISYIAMNVTCNGTQYFIKWEAPGSWEVDPGTAPGCESMTPTGAKVSGASLGFTVTVSPEGIASVTVPPTCTVQDVAVKGGQLCDYYSGLSGDFRVGCPKGDI